APILAALWCLLIRNRTQYARDFSPEVAVPLPRRSLIRTGTLAAAWPILDRLGEPVGGGAHAQAEQERQWRHGLSLFGELKYPQGFRHFDYVNATAPKAGSVRLNAFGTLD